MIPRPIHRPAECCREPEIDIVTSVNVGWYDCNAGFPSSRTRSEQISLTLLGDRKRYGYWSCLEVVAIPFPDRVVPRQWCLEQLERLGCSSPEDILARVRIPTTVLHVRTVSLAKRNGDLPLTPEGGPLENVLRAALILGKCTESVYDPERPSIWTNRALTRTVALYSPGDFYAD